MPDFTETQTQEMIRSAVRELVESYDEEYWREHRREQEFVSEFWDDLAEGGWAGLMIPDEYGGGDMGLQEMLIVMEEMGRNGAWAETSHLGPTPIFGGETLTRHGTEEQKAEWLPRIVDGDAHWALGVTEPDAGLNTTNISTFAEKDGDEYVINGRKMWISGVGNADRITLLTRTLPKEESDGPSHGISIFLIDPETSNVEYEEIPMEIFSPEKTYNVYIDDARVHKSQMVGEEHKGLYHIFDILNAERIVVAGVILPIGYTALERACEYANEREVFEAPIGSHQAIQHPLAEAYASLECARTLTYKAAWMYDNDEDPNDVGTTANVAKLKGVEAAWEACEAAMTTFGGMSASKEIEIGKMWSLVRHHRTIPVSKEMILNYLGENELELPKSY